MLLVHCLPTNSYLAVLITTIAHNPSGSASVYPSIVGDKK